MVLHNLQSDFKNSVITSEENSLEKYIFENGLTAKNRLQIYRNNIFTTLTETLKNIYPVIESLVGEDFFAGVASHYMTLYPPISGDLNEFGHLFPEFLSQFKPAQSLPYLCDVANLEWAYHEVFSEERGSLFDFEKLEAVPEKKYNIIKFKLHPASRLLSSSFPILDIWRLCQVRNGNEETVDIAKGGQEIFIIRRQLEVTFEIVSKGEFALLSALKNGALFADACSDALRAESGIDINHCLQKHLLQCSIVSFSL